MNAPRYPYFNVDFCERDARTRRLASVGLAQARPNKYAIDYAKTLELKNWRILQIVNSPFI